MKTSYNELNNFVLGELVKGASLGDILDGMEDKFKLTVYFCDTFGRVNAGPETDKFIKLFNTTKNLRAQMYADKFAMYSVPRGMIDENLYLVGPVKKDDVSAGFVIAGSSNRNVQFIRQAVILLAKLYCYFNHNRLKPRKQANDSLSYIIARELLLHEDDIAEKLIESNRERFYTFKPDFCIACIQPDISDGTGGSVNPSEFRRCIPYSYTADREDGFLAFIYSVDDYLNSSKNILDQLNAFCEKNNCCCCVSSKFSQLSNRHAYVHQAVTLLPICRGICNERVYLADDYYCEYMCSFTANKLEPAIIDLTAVMYLLDYDSKHSTNYLHTLDCYVNSDNSSTQAAKELFIDRSTLSYRLKKIVSIVPIDINDPAIALKLKLGLIVLKTLHPDIVIPE